MNQLMLKSALFIQLILLPACAGIQSHSDYLKASNFFQKEAYASAYFLAKKAHDLSQDNFKYAILLAWAAFKLGQTYQAEFFIKPFESKYSTDIKMIQLKAWIDYTLGNDNDASLWFQKEIDWAESQSLNKKSLYRQSIQSDAYYGLGLLKSRLKQFEQSRQLFQKALLYPNQFIGHRPIRIAHADTYYFSGDYDTAIQSYQAIKPQDNTIDIKIAWCLFYSKKYNDAEIFLLDKLYNTNKKAPLLYALFFTTYTQGKINQAHDYWLRLIELDPVTADTQHVWDIINATTEFKNLPIQLAEKYYEKGYFLKASKIIKTVMETNPSNCHARQIDSWCELYQSHAMIALSQFNQLAVDQSCDNALGQLGQGLSLLYLGYYDDATLHFQKISKDSEYYLRAQMALGGISYLTGHCFTAISTLEKHKNQLLLEQNHHFWPYLTLNTLGWCYMYTNDYQKAETIFAQLNNESSELAGLHLMGLAWSKYQQGNSEGAVSDLLTSNIPHLNFFKQSILLASAFYLKGDYQNAIVLFEANLSNIPEKELFFSWGSFALQYLGWSYIHTGQYQKALDIFFKLKHYHPSPIYFASYANLGWGYYYMGMIDQSEKEFQAAKTFFPDNPLIINGLQLIQDYRRSDQ